MVQLIQSSTILPVRRGNNNGCCKCCCCCWWFRLDNNNDFDLRNCFSFCATDCECRAIQRCVFVARVRATCVSPVRCGYTHVGVFIRVTQIKQSLRLCCVDLCLRDCGVNTMILSRGRAEQNGQLIIGRHSKQHIIITISTSSTHLHSMVRQNSTYL